MSDFSYSASMGLRHVYCPNVQGGMGGRGGMFDIYQYVKVAASEYMLVCMYVCMWL